MIITPEEKGNTDGRTDGRVVRTREKPRNEEKMAGPSCLACCDTQRKIEREPGTSFHRELAAMRKKSYGVACARVIGCNINGERS